MAAERSRIAHIQGVAARLGLGEAWATAQINGGFSIEQVNGAALTQHAANAGPAPIAAPRVELGVDRHAAAVGQSLVDAMLIRGNSPLLAINPDTRMPIPGQARQAAPFAGRFRGTAVMMAQQFLELCGRSTVGMSGPEIAHAAFVGGPRVAVMGSAGSMTTSDFPYLLATAAGISMQARYMQYPQQWPLFAVERPANDLREQHIVKKGALPILPEVKEGGEYTYVAFGEDREIWQLAKRGEIVALSEEMIINDQVGAFMSTLADEGDASARTDETLAFSVITANAAMNDTGTLFNATAVTTAGGHANWVAHGSGAAPSVTTLNAMEAAFGAQSAPPKNLADTRVYLDIYPGVLLVPRALRASAILLTTAMYDPAGTAGTLPPNPWNGKLKVASHRILDAVATHGGKQWFACTDPSVAPAMILGYLDGMRGPQLSQESGFDTDTRKFKVKHYRAAKATDWRFWYGNDGE
jgi:hypothetical protein